MCTVKLVLPTDFGFAIKFTGQLSHLPRVGDYVGFNNIGYRVTRVWHTISNIEPACVQVYIREIRWYE